MIRLFLIFGLLFFPGCEWPAFYGVQKKDEAVKKQEDSSGDVQKKPVQVSSMLSSDEASENHAANVTNEPSDLGKNVAMQNVAADEESMNENPEEEDKSDSTI